MTDTRRVILAEEFAQALASAGLIEGDVNRIRRIVIDAQAGYVVMVYVEHVADERWLDAGLFLEGVQVHTGPPAQDSRLSLQAAQKPAVSAGAPASGE